MRDRLADHSEIEVTPEMIQSGFRMFVAPGITDDPLEEDILSVERKYNAIDLHRNVMILWDDEKLLRTYL